MNERTFILNGERITRPTPYGQLPVHALLTFHYESEEDHTYNVYREEDLAYARRVLAGDRIDGCPVIGERGLRSITITYPEEN